MLQNTKTLLKNAIDINMSMNEHLLKFNIKDIINTAPARIVVLNNKFEHLNNYT